MVEQLNWALSFNEAGSSSENSASTQNPVGDVSAESFYELKALIIKSTDMLNAYYDKINKKLEGQYVSQADFDAYKKEPKYVLPIGGAELGGVVEDCVNKVGVDLNTASVSLLKYIAGVSSATAKNIVAFREENGKFTARRQLLKVAKLGPKAYEQCAGFLRVAESKNPLDNTGVHPESYTTAKELLKLVDYSDKEIKTAKFGDLPQRVKQYGTKTMAEKLEIGLPTLDDIVKELSKPGRDPRGSRQVFSFDASLRSLSDLSEGMIVPGIVSNVTNFGCFVDLGIKTKGLVHVSQLADKFVRDPSEVVQLQQQVMVKVIEIDEKGRINLSRKDALKELAEKGE